MANILITGAAGFIGSHLAEALLGRGHQVRGFDNLSTGRRENLPAAHRNFAFLEGDLRDPAALRAACDGIDIVLHQAALPSVPRSIQDPATSHAVNLNGTQNLLEAARAAHVRRVIYAASSSAYGNQPGFPRVETMTPEPLSPYAVQKLAGELYLHAYHRVYGLETVALRYFNIFGPRQDAGSQYAGVIARWAADMLHPDPARPPTLFGDGEQGRDFTFVGNVVRANLLAIEAPATRVAGRVFNIACGQRHTLNELFRELAHRTGFAEPPVYAPAREGDVRDSHADISSAREAFGYTPEVSFPEGLTQTVAWYRSTTLESK
ncbi:MAG: SDR family oxidoreductase [Acidobacteriota bacterium]|nr:SDR family oxidoreductase [Acidobacteriota bacterium]